MSETNPNPTRFAFLAHPRNNVAEDMASVNRLLGLVPNGVYEYLIERLPLKPWIQNRIYMPGQPDQILGECIIVPLTPRMLLGRNRKLVDRRLAQAIDLAQARGAQLVGLGALTAPALSGGRKLAKRDDIGVTNGNAFTAVATIQAVANAAQGLPAQPVIALVGASGSVGSAVTAGLDTAGLGAKLILIGRNRTKLTRLADNLATPTTVSDSIAACREAQIIVLMTSATETLLTGEHISQGAIVIDDTQPRNTSPALVQQRPDVKIIDGGLIVTAGLPRHGRSIGLPHDISFACLAETMLLALAGHTGHGVIGDPQQTQVAHLAELAARYNRYGFNLAAPTSFGQPITVPGWPVSVPAAA